MEGFMVTSEEVEAKCLILMEGFMDTSEEVEAYDKETHCHHTYLGTFHHHHPKCAEIEITHLAYADDLLLFVRGDTSSVGIRLIFGVV